MNGSYDGLTLIGGLVDPRHESFGPCDPANASGCPISGVLDLVGAGVQGDHATSMARLMVGENGDGYRGVAPDARLLSLGVVGADGTAWAGDLMRALDWLSGHPDSGVRFAAVPLASAALSPAVCHGYGALLEDIVADLARSGVRVFAPVGNSGDPIGVGFPACVTGVVSVGAHYAIDHPAARAYPEAGCIDEAPRAGMAPCFVNGRQAYPDRTHLSAPGVDIRVGPNELAYSGTSWSVGIITALAALVAEDHPEFDASEIVEWIYTTGGAQPEAWRSSRRVDATAAVTRQCQDQDGDGFGAGGAGCRAPVDCNDEDLAVHPAAEEVPDGIDNDCDGATDED